MPCVHELFKSDGDVEPGNVPPEVLAYWRRKKLTPSFSYKDVWAAEHAMAFAAAKVMREDVLQALRDELEKADAEGKTFDVFAKSVEPRMKALGWWEPQEAEDPQTGKSVFIKPPARLRTIFQTNMRAARAERQYDRVVKGARFRPYLLYQVGPSVRHREQHLAWHGLLLPVEDSFWAFGYPPNGWGCKCHVRSVTKSEAAQLDGEGILAPNPEPELDDDGLPTGHVKDVRIPVQRTAPTLPLIPWENDRTGRVELVPQGIDPGFQHRPGEGRRKALERAPAK